MYFSSAPSVNPDFHGPMGQEKCNAYHLAYATFGSSEVFTQVPSAALTIGCC